MHKQSHREEAPIALGYVNNLTENALNKLNKQTQEQQQMANQEERTKQRITAHKNQLRNQAKKQDSPDRAKPKAKTEPKPNPILKITEPLEMVTPPVNDAPQKHMLRILYRKTQKEGLLSQIPSLQRNIKKKLTLNQIHRLLKQTRVELPDMTPIGIIASQEPTGTRKTRHM